MAREMSLNGTRLMKMIENVDILSHLASLSISLDCVLVR